MSGYGPCGDKQSWSGSVRGRKQALAWLDVERTNLVATVADAANTGRNRVAIALAVTLAGCPAEFLSWRRQLDDWTT
jgi:hypothetical protein